MSKQPMLNPLGYCEAEAIAMVGKEIVATLEGFDGRRFDGHRGLIIATQKSTYMGQYEYCLVVQWKDRMGDVSGPDLYSKEALQASTRKLRPHEKAVSVARKLKRSIGENKAGLGEQMNRSRDQGLGM